MALGELILSHLCPAVDPVLVQPHIPDPHLLHYQVFSSVLIRLTCCCLHSSPSCSNPSQTPLHIREAAPRSSDREQASLPSAPAAFPALPPLGVWLCGLCGVLSHPLCLCTLVPLSQSQGAVHRTQKEGGPAIHFHSSRGRPCPLSSHSPQWMPLTIYECPHLPPSYECRKAPQPSVFCPMTPALAVSFSRMFSQRVSGLQCLPRKVKVTQSCRTLYIVRLHGLYSQWNSPGQNTKVAGLSLLQGIFPTQGSNPG